MTKPAARLRIWETTPRPDRLYPGPFARYDLEVLRNAEPFVPFTVVARHTGRRYRSDGSIVVNDPKCVTLGDEAMLYRHRDGEVRSIVYWDIELIISLDPEVIRRDLAVKAAWDRRGASDDPQRHPSWTYDATDPVWPGVACVRISGLGRTYYTKTAFQKPLRVARAFPSTYIPS